MFAGALEKVRETARDQGGWVSEEQVQEEFKVLDLSADQLQMVYDYLLKHHIGINQPLDPDEFLTNKEKSYLQIYLDELAAIEPVSEGEREAVTLSAMAGDVDAQARLTELCLPEVVEIARLYTGQGVYLEDLIGEGNVALTIGVTMLGMLENADEARGMLAKMIMDAMEKHIAENEENTLSDERAVKKVNRVVDAAKALSEELHRKVTVQELAGETKLSESMIREALRLSGNNIEYLEVERDDETDV